MKIFWRATLLTAPLLGLACMDVCGCPPLPASAAVYGRVQTVDGSPVAQARVSAYVGWDGTCVRREYSDGSTQTRDNGSYRVLFVSGGEDEAMCVRIQVSAPLDSDLRDAPDTTVTLAFRFYAPFDSTRVDATLSPP